MFSQQIHDVKQHTEVFCMFLSRLIGERGLKRDQGEAIIIDGIASVGTAGIEDKPGFSRRGPGDHAIAGADILLDLSPDHVAHLGSVIADINTGSDFQQPHSQAAAQAGRNVLNHDDQHRRTAPRG
ncbi:hypothetical protein PHAMO_40038 [Magnetospirillum molischianum DSM 120]|uniref:Uncharacterized protein n=1 Tax=Magnetospirillum molischianum DSM 120 TaxID=1150626 RepID=H8FVT9_MAGML|nr:hypothetical protein PHAMO_40038 [Magnetospirillum molischianum DSM 120]